MLQDEHLYPCQLGYFLGGKVQKGSSEEGENIPQALAICRKVQTSVGVKLD